MGCHYQVQGLVFSCWEVHYLFEIVVVHQVKDGLAKPEGVLVSLDAEHRPVNVGDVKVTADDQHVVFGFSFQLIKLLLGRCQVRVGKPFWGSIVGCDGEFFPF